MVEVFKNDEVMYKGRCVRSGYLAADSWTPPWTLFMSLSLKGVEVNTRRLDGAFTLRRNRDVSIVNRVSFCRDADYR